MWSWKKKHLLREAIEEEAELVEELKKDYKDNRLSPKEYRGLMDRWRHLVFDLRILIPAEPLRGRAFYMRLGVVFGACAVVLLAAGVAVKQIYFPHGIRSFSSGEAGQGGQYRYIPEQIGTVAAFPLVTNVQRSDFLDIVRFESVEGKTVGVFDEGGGIISILYTRQSGKTFSLYRRAFDFEARLEIEAEKNIPVDGDILDASIVQEKERYLMAYALKDQDKQKSIFLRAFNRGWKPLGEVKEFSMADDVETALGLRLVQGPAGNYYLVTTKFFGERESAENKTAPIVRELGGDFQLARSRILHTANLSLDISMSLAPLPAKDGFAIVANGRDPIAPSEIEKGDELFVLEYDKNWELQNIIRVTTTGAHNFWPGQVVMENNIWFVPYQKVERVRLNADDDNGYPADAGKIFVMALQNQHTIVGTLFFADYSARKPGGDKLHAGRGAHIVKSGKRMFLAHDSIVEDDLTDTKGNGNYRILRLSWIDTNTAPAPLALPAMTPASPPVKEIDKKDTKTPAAQNQPIGKLKILDTPTSWLRVRTAPSLSAKEIARVNPGKEYPYLKEEQGWYQIQLNADATGWVLGSYIKVIE